MNFLFPQENYMISYWDSCVRENIEWERKTVSGNFSWFFCFNTELNSWSEQQLLWHCINNYLRMRVLFMRIVTSRAVWHLTLHKISPSQASYFGHTVNWQITFRVNLGLDRSPTLVRGFPTHFHIPHQVLRFLTLSDNGQHGLQG